MFCAGVVFVFTNAWDDILHTIESSGQADPIIEPSENQMKPDKRAY